MRLEGFTDLSLILRGGVYALCLRGKVIYVGQSKACLSRIYTHKANRSGKVPSWVPVKGISFDEVHVYPCGPDDRDRVEREMIDRYRPKYNVHHKTSGPLTAPIPLVIGSTVFMLNQATEPLRRRA